MLSKLIKYSVCLLFCSNPTLVLANSINCLAIEHKLHEIQSKHQLTSLAFVASNKEQILCQKTMGFIDNAKRSPVDEHTIFSLGSQSKIFTALAAAIANDAGLINLNKNISQYSSELSINSRFNNKNPFEEITFVHLLSNTSGIPKFARKGNIFTMGNYGFSEHVLSIKDMWLQYPVGQRYNYSNLNFDLTAFILEKVSKKDFAKFVDENIFQALDMTDASFDINKIKAQPNRAIGHVEDFNNVPVKVPTIAGGQLYASIADMAKFLSFELNLGQYDNKQIIHPETLSLLNTIPNDSDQTLSGYALGREILKINEDIRIYKHSGGGYGFSSLAAWSADLNLGVELVFNSEPAAALEQDLQTLVYQLFDISLSDNKVQFSNDKDYHSKAKKITPEIAGEFSYAQSPFETKAYHIKLHPTPLLIQGSRQTPIKILDKNSFIMHRSFIPIKSLHILNKPIEFKYIFYPSTDKQSAYLHNEQINHYYDKFSGHYDKSSCKTCIGTYQFYRYGQPAKIMHVYQKKQVLFIEQSPLQRLTKTIFYAPNGWIFEPVEGGAFYGGIFIKKLN